MIRSEVLKKIIIEKKNVERKEITLEPCIKCGGVNLKYEDMGASSFNHAYFYCVNCGHKPKNTGASCFPDKERICGIWNEENSIQIQIEVRQDQIKRIKKEIKGLKKLKESREINRE